MKTLFEIDLQDYDEKAPRVERPSVRGIILKDGKIALVHSLKYDYYKFPGGGCKKDENHIETLVREVKEETGLVVNPNTIEEFGMVHRIQKGDFGDTFVQDNFYYMCQVEDEENFTLEFITIDEAIAVNKNHHHGEKEEDMFYKVMIERESRVLALVKDWVKG